MGYWNGWTNYAEWSHYNGNHKKCESCGDEFIPRSPTQKYCQYDENPVCFNERELESMPLDKWIEIHGIPVSEFKRQYGITVYNMLKNGKRTLK